jgi:heptosyltransferase-3
MLMQRRNILILHTGALGDFVLAWPLIMALGRLHPQSRIIVVTHASKGALAEAALRVESADIESGWHGLFDAAGTIEGPAEKLLAGANWIYSFIFRKNDPAAAAVHRAAPEAWLVALASKPPASFSEHASEFLAAQLQDRPAVGIAVRQMLKVIAERGLGHQPVAGGPVLVHPGSGSARKNWPRERFIELIRLLKGRNLTVRVLLGEVEQEKWSEHDISTLAAEAPIAHPATYLDLFNELRQAALLIANDSGPGHLSGIMGIATLSLFGPTDPAVWKPLGPRVRVLRAQPLESLTVEQVLKAAMLLL